MPPLLRASATEDRHELRRVAFDLGAAPFTASGSVPPLLFGLRSHPPQFRHAPPFAETVLRGLIERP